MAAPFLPPISAPATVPPPMMAAVRALRPKRERLRLSCALTDMTVVASSIRHIKNPITFFMLTSPPRANSFEMADYGRECLDYKQLLQQILFRVK
jgi:hypothetical protein